MSLPCYDRLASISAIPSTCEPFSWGLPNGRFGLVRGPEAQAFIVAQGLDIDLTVRSPLECRLADTSIRLCAGDLTLPGKLWGPDEVLPPRTYPNSGASMEEISAYLQVQPATVAALVIINDADPLLAQAYLDLTGKSIPVIDLRRIDLESKIIEARAALGALLAQKLTADAYIPRFQSMEEGTSGVQNEESSRYFGSPFMPETMAWPNWRWGEKSGPYLFYCQYQVSDLPDPVRACLPEDVTSFLVFVNPIIDVWPHTPDNPPYELRFVRAGEKCALYTAPSSSDQEAPLGRDIARFCRTRDTGSAQEYSSRPDARPEFFELADMPYSVSEPFFMSPEAERRFVLDEVAGEVLPESPLLRWEGDKFLGEPIWLQSAEYRSSRDGTPMIAFLHIFYDGVPDLAPPPEALSRDGAGIIWLPRRWVKNRTYESQVEMTWDMG